MRSSRRSTTTPDDPFASSRRWAGWIPALGCAAALASSGCGDANAAIDAGSVGEDGGADRLDTGSRDGGAGPPAREQDAGPPMGACCTIDGTCMDLAEVACRDVPRFHSWHLGACDTFACPDERQGACCAEEGCVDGVTVDACIGFRHGGEGSTCAETDCTSP